MNSSKRIDPSERFSRNGSGSPQARLERNVTLRNSANQGVRFPGKLDGTAVTTVSARTQPSRTCSVESRLRRIFTNSLREFAGQSVLLRGWVYRLRVLGRTTFVILRDCSGQAQCVAATETLKHLHLKSE